jgi:uncharacterized membrane protein YebE (DUF533 family)
LSGDFLGDRRASLENAFFAQQDAALRRRMAESDLTKAKKAALVDASGINDGAVLDKLLALNITSETLTAISLVPLVAVAWADGSIDANERDAVLAAAEKSGVNRQSPNHELLNGWLAKKPSPELVTAWKQYVSALLTNLDSAAKLLLKAEILGRAKSVAEAAGGFLGLTARISEAEQRVLDDLEKTFLA